MIVGKTVPSLGAGQDGYGWVYNHGTGAMVWTDMATQAELNTHTALTTTAHGGLIASSEKAAASGVASLDSSSRVVQDPKLHASAHQPGGVDAMAVDAAAATGSLRTLGTSATSAAAGNDSRLSDARTPTAHKTSHEPGGSDAMTVDAAAGTGSLRTIGKTALKAADGADTEYAFSAWKPMGIRSLNVQLGSGIAATTFLWFGVARTLNAINSGDAAFYIDPADFGAGSRTTQLRMRTAFMTNSTAPGVNFTFALQPVASWGTVSNTSAVVTLSAAVLSTVKTTPGASTQFHDETSAITFPAAGWYVFSVVNSGTTATNSSSFIGFELQYRQV